MQSDRELILPIPLAPREKMPPNLPCWCGSGKKWKKCHKDRESQKPESKFKLLTDMRCEFVKGYCLHPNAGNTCGPEIIKAHTIQKKSRGLSAVAENGHVISPKRGFEELIKNKGVLTAQLLGVNKASTFMGFCNVHDDQLFKSIETSDLVDQNAAFLFSFRAIALEVFNRETVIRGFEVTRNFDKGLPFTEQCKMQQMLHISRCAIDRGKVDIDYWKSEYDSAFLQKNYSDFSYYGVRFDTILPIVSSGAFFPDYDFEGQVLQSIGFQGERYEHVSFNLTTLMSRSLCILGWIGDPDGPAQQFVAAFKKLPDGMKANAAMCIACEYIENTYIKPSWWNSISPTIIKQLYDRFRSGGGGPGSERKPSTLVELTPLNTGCAVLQEFDL